jgi:hypothetical protein
MPPSPYAALVTIRPVYLGVGLKKNFANFVRNLFLTRLLSKAFFWDSERFNRLVIKVVVSCYFSLPPKRVAHLRSVFRWNF